MAGGVVIGLMLPYTYNAAYSLYISVAILACLDSVFGGLKANLEDKFDTSIFISGFFLEIAYSLLAFF